METICVVDTNISKKLCGLNTSPIVSQWNKVHVEYARVGFVFGMPISCCLCQFHLCWVANSDAFSGGIWAYVYSQSTTLRIIS